jgi:aspartate-semialdehyde dehydrogenase
MSTLDKGTERPLIAVVGGDTLLAREVRSVFEAAKPAPRVKLIAATAGAVDQKREGGEEGEEHEEETPLLPLSIESLEGSRVVMLAGSPASSRRALKLNLNRDAKLIDLTGALEEQPQARLRGPIAEAITETPVASAIQVIAHPAAIVLAKFLTTVSRCSVVRVSLAHIFEPASERGKAGIEELQQQTVALLRFQKLPTEVFDDQLAFNVLARYGEEAREPLEGVEQRAERHLASLLAGWPGVPMPSLRMIQVPVFHGHSFSVWVEFQTNPGVKALTDTLERGGFDVRTDHPPSNARMAGETGIGAGAIAEDRNNSRAFWFWLTTDNLKLTAENAVAVAQEIL